MPPERAQAIVLAVRDYAEADCLVTFLTAEHGRLTALAKHARKSRRRFMNCLEPLSCVEYMFTHKPHQELARLERGELIEAWRGLRRSLLSLATAAILAESSGELVGGTDSLAAMFATLQQALSLLAAEAAPWSVFLSHLSRQLALAGFGPQWQGCQLCGQEGGSLAFLRPRQGGLVCQNCVSTIQGERLWPLHLGSRKLLLAAQQLPLAHLARLRFPAAARQETWAALQAYLHLVIGRELKSCSFLAKIIKLIQ